MAVAFFAPMITPYDIQWPKMCLIIALIVCVLHIFIQQTSDYKGMWYKPSNIFLLSYIIVSFQYVIDLIIGFKGYGDFYMPHTVNRVVSICTLGLISFALGMIVSKNNNISSKFLSNRKIDKRKYSISFLVFLQLFFFIFWLITIDINFLLSGASYFVDVSGTAQANFESLLYACTIAILTCIVLNLKDEESVSIKVFLRSSSWISWAVISLYCILRLISGDRGPCIYTLLAVFFCYIICSKKSISIGKILLAIIAVSFVLNIVGLARTRSTDQSFLERLITSYTDFSESSEARFSEKTILPLTEELATSSRCNQIAVDLIDNGKENYHYGMYFVYQTLQCIPFVSSFLYNTLKIPVTDLSANILMTDVYFGRHDLSQIGTTITADPYLDLGIGGVLIMLFIVGFVYKKIDYGICIKTPDNWFLIIIILLLASMAIYIPRATFISQFKQVIPISVLFLLNKGIRKKEYE